jgi:TRAP transporter TAXI family solute receptor
MRRLGSVILVLGSLVTLAGAQGAPGRMPRTELMIVTGSEYGTYYAMARDVKRLLDEVVPEAGLTLAVVPSPGALQNVVDVFRYQSIHLGMTQTDVLDYLEIYARGDPDARRILGGLQIASGLYDEDVYLIARPGIRGLDDLTGKRVDIGLAGSGTTVTALVLLHLAGVQPREMVNFPQVTDAITALRKGRIDAFFRVTATPAQYLAEGISPSHGFVLVPIRLSPKPDMARLAQHYRRAVIPAKAYPWLDHPVETVKVGARVVTAGDVPGSPACVAIGRLVEIMREHLPWLQENGHPKWKDVARDPAEILADPRISPCVVQAYRR